MCAKLVCGIKKVCDTWSDHPEEHNLKFAMIALGTNNFLRQSQYIMWLFILSWQHLLNDVYNIGPFKIYFIIAQNLFCFILFVSF